MTRSWSRGIRSLSIADAWRRTLVWEAGREGLQPSMAVPLTDHLDWPQALAAPVAQTSRVYDD
jgi:hypothetical protein